MADSSYKPPTGFVEDGNEALVDLNLIDSTELWLLQVPSSDFFSDIDGKELSLKLDNDGQLASFEGSSGKVYDFVSFAAQEPDETVFVPSATEPKIAGKISRRISVVHYSDPKEHKKLNSSKTRITNPGGAATMATSSRYFPMQSSNPRSSQSGRAASSKGSKQKSSLSEVSEPSNSMKKPVSNQVISNGRHVPELSAGSAASSKGGTQKSSFSEVSEPSNSVKKPVSNQVISNGRRVPELSDGHNPGISPTSSQHSHERKSKKRKLKE